MPVDPEGGIITAEVVAWLGGLLGPEWPVAEGPHLPDLPERIAVVTRTGGPGLRYEGAYDAVAFQVRVRGASAAPSGSSGADAERMAWRVDAELLSAQMPTIGGVVTLGWSRTGSPPTPEEDSGDRVVMSTDYVVLAASVIF